MNPEELASLGLDFTDSEDEPQGEEEKPPRTLKIRLLPPKRPRKVKGTEKNLISKLRKMSRDTRHERRAKELRELNDEMEERDEQFKMRLNILRMGRAHLRAGSRPKPAPKPAPPPSKKPEEDRIEEDAAFKFIVEACVVDARDEGKLPVSITGVTDSLVRWDSGVRLPLMDEYFDPEIQVLRNDPVLGPVYNPTTGVPPLSQNDQIEAHELLARALCLHSRLESGVQPTPADIQSMCQKTIYDLQDRDFFKSLFSKAGGWLVQHTKTTETGEPQPCECSEMMRTKTPCRFLRFGPKAAYVSHMMGQTMTAGGNVMVCLSSGRAHRCDFSKPCSQASMSRQDGEWVCPLSGHTFFGVFASLPKLMNPERASRVMNADAWGEREDADPGFGSLGAGYGSEAEDECCDEEVGPDEVAGGDYVVDDYYPVSLRMRDDSKNAPDNASAAVSRPRPKGFSSVAVKGRENTSWVRCVSSDSGSLRSDDGEIAARAISLLNPRNMVRSLVDRHAGDDPTKRISTTTKSGLASIISKVATLGTSRKKQRGSTPPVVMSHRRHQTRGEDATEMPTREHESKPRMTQGERLHQNLASVIKAVMHEICMTPNEYRQACLAQASRRLSEVRDMLLGEYRGPSPPGLLQLVQSVQTREAHFEALLRIVYEMKDGDFEREHEDRVFELNDCVTRALNFIIGLNGSQERAEAAGSMSTSSKTGPGFGFQDIRPLVYYITQIIDGAEALPPDLMVLDIIRSSPHPICLTKPLSAETVESLSSETGKKKTRKGRCYSKITKIRKKLSCIINKVVHQRNGYVSLAGLKNPEDVTTGS